MYERFTDRARKVMQLANQEAQRFNHEYVGTEHILLGLVKEGTGVAANVLKNLDVDLRKIRLEVEKIVQSGPDMVSGKLPQTPRARKVVEYSIEEARNLNHNYIGTEHLLLGLLREQEGVGAQVLTILGLKLEVVREEVLNLLGHNAAESSGGERHVKQLKPLTALDRFGRDLTELARRARLDPCVGRENDLEQLIRVLGRRARNRPLLLGEAGAGKTALVRKLAYVLEGLQPGYCLSHAVGFRGHRLVCVGLPSLVAGASRGQLDERIRAIADEARTQKAILFFDDFHLWASHDAALFGLASVLDSIPYCLAATVPAGFARLAAKLSTLERSFRPVHVPPLAPAEVVHVLQGLRERLEVHHHVCILDAALRAAVEFAAKAGGKGAPLIDLALDVIDEAAARVRQHAMTPPPDLTALDGEIEKLNVDKEAAIAEQDFEKAAATRDRADKLRMRKESMTRDWRDRSRRADAVVDEEVVREFARQAFGFRVEPF